MAYIDKEKVKELITNYGKGAISDGLKTLDPADDIVLIVRGVDLIPVADVVEVVRCKDCKNFISCNEKLHYCKYHTDNASYCDECCWVTENDFCSYGERKEEE